MLISPLSFKYTVIRGNRVELLGETVTRCRTLGLIITAVTVRIGAACACPLLADGEEWTRTGCAYHPGARELPLTRVTAHEDGWQAGGASSSRSSTTRRRNMSSPKTEGSAYCLDSISWPCWDTSSGEQPNLQKVKNSFGLC